MDEKPPEEFSQLLQRAQAGSPEAENRFCELVNDELRGAAGALVRNQHGLAQPTSLVNEAYLRLFRKGVVDDLRNRRYFFAVAIDQMRQILRERFRTRKSQRRGGHMNRQALDAVLDQYLDDFAVANALDYMLLDEALEGLKNGGATARQYEVLRLHYFVGLQQKEIADLLDLDASVISKELRTARAKLALQLRGDS